jgi:hypothetical protein
MSEPQRFRDVTVSVPSRRTANSKPQIAISTSLDQYVQVDADRLRWLIEEAGPKALKALQAIEEAA